MIIPGNPFKDIKVILALIISIAITGCLILGTQQVLVWKHGSEVGAQREETLKATSGIVDDGVKADEERDKVDTGIAQGRDAFQNDYNEAEAHEPAIAARSTTAVPVSVRDAFRKRRLARERLGCAGEQCGEGPQGEEAPER